MKAAIAFDLLLAIIGVFALAIGVQRVTAAAALPHQQSASDVAEELHFDASSQSSDGLLESVLARVSTRPL